MRASCQSPFPVDATGGFEAGGQSPAAAPRARERRETAAAGSRTNLPGFLFVLLAVTAAHTPCPAAPIDWVTVGDPGNAADTTGYGAVAASFQIMKYEFTNQQYVDFLNAVDPDGINPDSIWNTNMGGDPRGGITYTSGNAVGGKYTPRANMADKPVTFVSWFDAARVSNWLQAGGINYGTSLSGSAAINNGAYTLNGATTGTAPAVNPGAQFYLPTEDQWYKAAYYAGGSVNAGYWTYATQSNSTPTAVTSDSAGTGSAGNAGTFANYSRAADWNGLDGNVTTAGTNGGPSAYGAFDMSGNVIEWNDLTGTAGLYRGRRGGSWIHAEYYLSSSFRSGAYSATEEDNYGFRVASSLNPPPGVPEIDPAGMGSVIAIVTGALGLFERRRRRT